MEYRHYKILSDIIGYRDKILWKNICRNIDINSESKVFECSFSILNQTFNA